jgi:hypothetical protein
MAFQKGVVTNPSGRVKGSENKTTTKFKEALNTLFEDNADQMMDWLAQIEDPKERFNVLKDFASYLYPKLSSVANTHKEITDKEWNELVKKPHE